MNNRDFTAPYVFQEFPKWVTLADGSQMLVHNADEEAVLTSADKAVLSRAAQHAANVVRAEASKKESAIAAAELAVHDAENATLPDAVDVQRGEVMRQALLGEAKSLGLNPHHKTGEDKLRAMIAEAKG